MRMAALLAATALTIAGAIGTGTAAAKGGGGGGGVVGAGRTVTVLPDTSGMELALFPANTLLSIEVLRNGVHLAGATVTTTAAGDAAVNGGTLGCWADATPDMLPGDVVRVTGPGFVDQSTVQNITTGRPVEDPVGSGTIVVHGTAQDASGNQLPAAGLEARIIGSSADRFVKNGRRDLRALSTAAAAGGGAGGGVAEGTIEYDNGTTTAWTARYTGLGAHDVSVALSAVDMRGIYTSPSLTEQTIAQAPVARGPLPPCTTPVRNRHAVTTSSPAAINAKTASDNLVLSGITTDATKVDVTLTDSAQHAVTVPATISGASGPQTFTATVPGSAVHDLADGRLTASATYETTGGTLTGGTLTVLKDTTVPPAPVATPGAGIYVIAQSVTLEDAEAGATIHWTAGGSTPTADSVAFTKPILVTASQTLQAVAVDAAGNTSAVAAFPFTIVPPILVVGAGGGGAPAPATPVTVLGAKAASTATPALRLSALTAPARIGAARLRSQGLALSMRLPAGTTVVRVAVYRTGKGGKRAGKALATLYRLTPDRAGTWRLRLRDRSAVRRMRPGRYVVEVTPGRSQTALGAASAVAITVTR